MDENSMLVGTDIPLKICIDEITDSKRYCGRIYNGEQAVYLPFIGENNLIENIEAFWKTIKDGRELPSLFETKGWEMFVSRLNIPWDRNFLFRKKGTLGSFYIHISNDDSLLNFEGSIVVIEQNHTLYFNTFESSLELRKELEKVIPCFMEISVSKRKEEFRKIKKIE